VCVGVCVCGGGVGVDAHDMTVFGI
jgi:hypothetical protein